MSRRIYLMPGMGASPAIFKGLRFPDEYRPVYMEWLMPEADEELAAYTLRLIRRYAIEENALLLGMSFGGVIIHEIAKQIGAGKLIFVSTVKTHEEFPPWYAWGRRLRIWRWLPYKLITNPARTARLFPKGKIRKRLMLWEQYMAIRDKQYFTWAMQSILNWQSPMPRWPYLHIHGSRDHIFPMRYLKGEIFPIPGAGHLAVMTHPKKVSKLIAAHLTENA